MQLPGIGSPVAARSGPAVGRVVVVDIRSNGTGGRAVAGARPVRICASASPAARNSAAVGGRSLVRSMLGPSGS